MALAIFAEKGIGFLPSVDIARIRQLSTPFKAYCSTNSIWREVFVRDFGVPSTDMQRMMLLAMHSSRRLFGTRNSQGQQAVQGTEPAQHGQASFSSGPANPPTDSTFSTGQNHQTQAGTSFGPSAVVHVSAQSRFNGAAGPRGISSPQQPPAGVATQAAASIYGRQNAPPAAGAPISQHHTGAAAPNLSTGSAGKQALQPFASPAYPQPYQAPTAASTAWPGAPAGYAYTNVYASSSTPYVYAQAVPRAVQTRTQERMLSGALGGSGAAHRQDPDGWRRAYRSTYMQKLHFNQLPVWLLVQRHEAALLRRGRVEEAGGGPPPGLPSGTPPAHEQHNSVISGVEREDQDEVSEDESGPAGGGSTGPVGGGSPSSPQAPPPADLTGGEQPTAPEKPLGNKIRAVCICVAAVLLSLSSVLLAARNDCLDSNPAFWRGPGLPLEDAQAREQCSGVLYADVIWLLCLIGAALAFAVPISCLELNGLWTYDQRHRTQMLSILVTVTAVLVQIILCYLKNTNSVDAAWGTVFMPLWLMMGVSAVLTCYAHKRLYSRSLYPFTFVAPFFGIAVPMMVITQRLDDETARLHELGLGSGVVAPGVISTDDPYAYPMIAFWLFCGLPSVLGTAFLTVDAGTGDMSTLKQKAQMGAMLCVAALAMVLSCNVAAADGQVLANEGNLEFSWHQVLWPLHVLPVACAMVLYLFFW